MTTEDTIRYLDHQAKLCRDRDSHEAFTLLLPAMMRVLGLERMDDVEAAAFRHSFKRDLAALPDRLAGHQEPPPKVSKGYFFIANEESKDATYPVTVSRH